MNWWQNDGYDYYKKNNGVGFGHNNNYKSGGATTTTTSTATVTKLEPTECFSKLCRMFWKPIRSFEAISFTEYAWAKMICFCHLAGTYEITGFGKIVDGVVTDVKILKQIVGSASVDVAEDAQFAFMDEIPDEELGLWILDWHSHVDMGAFASGTDTTNYNARFRGVSFPALIVNKKQEVCCYEWYGEDQRDTITVSRPTELTIDGDAFRAIYDECFADVAKFVSKKSYTTTYSSGTSVTYPAKATTTGGRQGSRLTWLDYLEWTDDDYLTCAWDETTEQFVKSDGKKHMSKNRRKKLIKLKQKVDDLRRKQKAKALALPQPKENECTHCGCVIKEPVEIQEGYCKACMINLFDIKTDYSDDTNEREIYIPCTICQEPIDTEDDAQVENGVCGACLEKYTHEQH